MIQNTSDSGTTKYTNVANLIKVGTHLLSQIARNIKLIISDTNTVMAFSRINIFT